jgi:hypothetical protein
MSSLKNGKIGREISEIIRNFKFQPTGNMCWTTSIHNILHDLSKMHQNTEIAIPLPKINRACGYDRVFGPKFEAVCPGMNRLLTDHGYRAFEGRGASPNFTLIKKIIDNKESSFPIVGVHHTYFSEQKPRYTIEGEAPDHCLILFYADDERVLLFDPYEGHLIKSSSVKEIHREISTVKFLDYWGRATDTRYVMWIEREKKLKYKTLPLTSFDRKKRRET